MQVMTQSIVWTALYYVLYENGVATPGDWAGTLPKIRPRPPERRSSTRQEPFLARRHSQSGSSCTAGRSLRSTSTLTVPRGKPSTVPRYEYTPQVQLTAGIDRCRVYSGDNVMFSTVRRNNMQVAEPPSSMHRASPAAPHSWGRAARVPGAALEMRLAGIWSAAACGRAPGTSW